MADDSLEGFTSAKLRVTALLSGLGGLAGAAAGTVLTYLGNVISGYPVPPSFGIYLWNSVFIAAVGAVVGPPLAWSMLRAVPVWRAVCETSAAGLAAGVLSMLVAPSFFVVAVPAGAVAAAVRLNLAYRNQKPAHIPSAESHMLLPPTGPE